MTRLPPVALFRWLVWRDVTLAWRRRSEALGTVLFFVIVIALFPLGVGSDVRLLRAMGAGTVWVAALLAAVLAVGRLFADDYADGSLEHQLLTPQPLALIVVAKVSAQWLVSAAPLLLVTPVAGVQFGLSPGALLVLTVSLALGTPVFLAIGAIGAALTLGLRGAASLTSLLVMPLSVPALVFGAAAVQTVDAGGAAGAHLRLLAAVCVLTVSLAPMAAAAALRISLE